MPKQMGRLQVFGNTSRPRLRRERGVVTTKHRHYGGSTIANSSKVAIKSSESTARSPRADSCSPASDFESKWVYECSAPEHPVLWKHRLAASTGSARNRSRMRAKQARRYTREHRQRSARASHRHTQTVAQSRYSDFRAPSYTTWGKGQTNE